MFLAEGLGAQVDATHLESAGGGRPRRGIAKRRVRSRALQENPVVLFLRSHVFLLPPDDAVKAFDESVPQVDAVKRCSVFHQRPFLLFAENMFVEKPLIGSLWPVVLAREALAVFPFDLIDQHLLRTEEVAEVRPFLAEPNQVSPLKSDSLESVL